jgi:hypothetical protein
MKANEIYVQKADELCCPDWSCNDAKETTRRTVLKNLELQLKGLG